MKTMMKMLLLMMFVLIEASYLNADEYGEFPRNSVNVCTG